MSMIGVWSRASRPFTQRMFCSRLTSSTRVRAIGFGRLGVRVAKIPTRGSSGFPRGWIFRRGLLALGILCSQKMTKMWEKSSTPSRALVRHFLRIILVVRFLSLTSSLGDLRFTVPIGLIRISSKDGNGDHCHCLGQFPYLC